MKTKLSVNLNKIALIRNARDDGNPSPCEFGRIALKNGAAGLTIHPRPDQRHIRSSDVAPLAEVVRSFPGAEYNIEGNPFHNLMDHVLAVRPDQATFVPDQEGQKTSDHGFNLDVDGLRVKPHIDKAKAAGVRVSLFLDPVPEEMAKAKELGADRVELYTEGYAKAFGTEKQEQVLAQYAAAAKAAHDVGLGVNAGHDLNLENLEALLLACKYIDEVSIGHALTAEALRFGMAETIRRYEVILERVAQKLKETE